VMTVMMMMEKIMMKKIKIISDCRHGPFLVLYCSCHIVISVTTPPALHKDVTIEKKSFFRISRQNDFI